MSPPFDSTEHALVRAAAADPADLTTWLVYADWLEEHDKPDRAEFLRLQVRFGQLTPGDPDRPVVEVRLGELRTALHPDWVAFFDRPPVENCGPEWAFRCPKAWEHLKPTLVVGARYCGACDRLVYYCRDLWAAQERAWRGECVAVSPGVERHPGDLDPPAPGGGEYLVMGRMFPAPPPRLRRRPWWKFW
ncbi:MAG: TIGR02996 domain-containing protein [Gemmataceae bacterium]|nr:TIGR02996 domain-containing protein [Gemmataceae bacterium]